MPRGEEGECMTHTIAKVEAVADVVDRLEWSVRILADGWGLGRAYVLHWDGHIALCREPGGAGSRLTIPARWTNREHASRFVVLPGERMFTFATDLPGDALDRVERFRASGPLHAYVEGTFVVAFLRDGNSEDWTSAVANMMGGTSRCDQSVRTESASLRELWCEKVLATLRAPGRYLLEVTIPRTAPEGEMAKRALARLGDAQGAFDLGNYPEVARLCYRALDEIVFSQESLRVRFGEFAGGSLHKQFKELKDLCNADRHGDRPRHAGFEVNRAFAEHALITASSLCAVALEGGRAAGLIE